MIGPFSKELIFHDAVTNRSKDKAPKLRGLITIPSITSGSVRIGTVSY
jgi:hypothetical protein